VGFSLCIINVKQKIICGKRKNSILMKGKSVIISAPSGAGKTTIVRHLLENRQDLEFSVSATTRTPRGLEAEGKDYYFLTIEEFRRRIENEEFVEWEEVYKDRYYGTLKSEMERIWTKGKNVLFDVDVKGGINLKKILGTQSIALFIMPPSIEELEKRLLKRATDNISDIKTRLAKAEAELEFANQFDRIIINKHLDQAVEEISSVISSFLKS
jgi:guanylate kinase